MVVRISRSQLKICLLGIILGIALFFTIDSGTQGMAGALLRVVVSCIFVWCIYQGSKEPTLFNPYFLFSITPLSLMIYSDKISTVYLQTLTVKTWMFIALNMICFLAALTLTKKKRVKAIQSVKNQDYPINVNWLNTNAWILTLLGMLPSWYQVLTKNALPMAYIFDMCLYAGNLCALKTKVKKCYIPILLLSLSRFVFQFNKSMFLMLGIVIIIGIERYYLTTIESKRKLILCVLAAGAFMVFIAFPLKSAMANGTGFFDFFSGEIDYGGDYYGDRIEWNGPAVLELPYMYMTTGWTNLQYVMETQNTQTYGLWFLKPLLGYFQLDGLFENQYALEPFSSFNTFTYLAVLFKDFGYYGSVFLSAFLGWFVKRVYVRSLETTDALNLTCYALTAQAVLEMFFSNHFFGISYPFTVIIALMIYRVVMDNLMRHKGIW